MARQNIVRFVARIGLNLKVDAYDFVAAHGPSESGTLAQFREADMRVSAQFQSSRYKDAVDLKAGASLEFEEDVDQAGVALTPAQNPTSASHNSACDCFHDASRLFPGNCFDL